MTLSPSSIGNLRFGCQSLVYLPVLHFLILDNNSKPEISLPDIQDYPITSLDVLDYSFHAFVKITHVTWYTSFNVG